MASNFFQQQDSARRKTFQLVVWLVLAIHGLIALVYELLLALSKHGAGEPVSWWRQDCSCSRRPGWALRSSLPARSRWPSSVPAAKPSL